MKALLTGAKGMLARAIMKRKPEGWEIQPFGKDLLDITDRTAVQETINRLHPDIILNCAGFTNVDACEEKKELAFLVNGIGVGYLAEGARRARALGPLQHRLCFRRHAEPTV